MSELPRHAPRYGRPNAALIGSMLQTPPDADAPFYAVNLMKYRERAEYADGTESTLSGREADDEYFPVEVLTKIGAEVVFVADVEEQLAGSDVTWERIAIVRYPTRRSMIEMNMREDFKKQHRHKEAGMEQTIVTLCEGEGCPIGPRIRSAADVPEPGDDPPRVIMHLVRLHEAVGPEEIPTSGLRPEVELDVAGTILGDGREWSRLRMTRF